MLKMDVIISKCYNKNHVRVTRKFLGGGGSSKTPLEQKFLRGGGCKPKTFCGRGMDIFWNHTL